MLTVYYEHLKDSEGNSYTELVCSSDRRSNYINWKVDDKTYEMVAKILKAIAVEKRIFDAQLKTWTFLGGIGIIVVEKLETLSSYLKMCNKNRMKDVPQTFFVESKDDIIERVRFNALGDNKWKKATESVPLNAEEFFYTPVPIAPVRAWKSELASLLGISEVSLGSMSEPGLKRLYREKALLYHPDKNKGDGSKMSALNELWRMWKEQDNVSI